MSQLNDFPGLFDADEQARRAVTLLEQAAAEVRSAGDGSHAWAERAVMLRGAVALAQTAVTQIATTAGWNEAASAANDIGILAHYWEERTDPYATEGTDD